MIYWFLGKPRAGKTFKALEMACLFSSTTGRPLIIVDTARVDNFQALEASGQLVRCNTPEEVILQAYKNGRHCIWTPRSDEDVERLLKGLCEARDFVLFMDEANHWCSAVYMSDSLIFMLRSHRHMRCEVLLTTQYVGDIAPKAFACDPEVYVFACSGNRNLKRVQDEFSMDPAEVEKLAQYQFKLFRAGF